jgi:uncharacterized protein YqeY
MNLLAQIESDLSVALKAREELKVQTLRMAVTALKNARIAKMADLEEAEAVDVLRKEAKKRQEAITAYESAGRPELAEGEKQEMAIIEAYLPAQMSQEQVKAIAQEVLDSGITEFGLAMKEVMQRVKGQADGGLVSKVVKDIKDGQ